MQPDGRLQIGPLQRLAKQPAELAVHADADICVDQFRHVGEMTPKRKDEIDLRTDTFDKTADLSQIAGHIEGAVTGADDIDTGFLTLFPDFAGWNFFGAVFDP